MILDQLRIFIAVAEREHMTRAVAALNLTQSATSAAIAALEDRHGTVLFERIGRGIRRTKAGHRFLPEARAVLARAEAASRLLDDVADLRRGRLALSASQTLANHWLPGVMVRFHRAHPGIEVSLTIGNSAQVVTDVLDLRADLGFAEGQDALAGLVSTALGGDELWLVVAPGHPCADGAPGR